MSKRILFSITIFWGYCNLFAQVEKNAPLFLELLKEDSIFFERSFNQCDIAYLEQHITEDLKFYHDQSGISGRAAFLNSVAMNICGNSAQKPIRRPVPGSFSVFPLYNNGVLYGAIQNGTHNFYLREEGKADRWTSGAKFTSVWIKEDDLWKMSSVLSFDHQSEAPITQNEEKTTIEALLAANHVPALGLGIIEDGQLTKVEIYGTLDKERVAPYNTIFKVASLTKPVFTMTVLRLIDSGQLRLDEPLHPYWVDPDVAEDQRHRKLTPRLVLTHQTGFPNWRYLTENKKLEIQFEPGTKLQYSGEGFEYLRKAIEKKTGKTIESLAEELIFKPAGMNDTRFWWDETMDEDRYAQNFDSQGQKISTVKYYEANAAANLLTTVEDYGKFLVYVINGAGISEDLYEAMCSPQAQMKPDNYIGFGWEMMTNLKNDETALLHSGRDPGVNTLAVFFPKSKNGYLIFMNGDNMLNIFEHLLLNRVYFGDELWKRK